jgi:hypothetical protein
MTRTDRFLQSDQRLQLAAAGPWLFGGLAIVILAAQVPDLLRAFDTPNIGGFAGIDYDLYMDATHRWLAGGPFYGPHQLAGPYEIRHGDILYPPVSLWLFVPFTVLPPLLWWIGPLAGTAAVVVALRPHWVVWPFLALCLWQPVQIHIISGNPVIWSLLAVALGTIYKWPSVFAFVKPSLGFFGLFGIRHRSWWAALGVFCVMSLVLLPMWADWITVLQNARGGGLEYSWQEIPLLLLPIIAWMARPGGRYGVRPPMPPA